LLLSSGQLLQWMWRRSFCLVGPSRVHASFCFTQHRPHGGNPPPNFPEHQNSMQQPLTLGALLDMGFSETEAEVMYEGTSKARGKHVSSVLSTLFALGLSPSNLLKVVKKCPDVYLAKGADLQKRIDHLRKLGLVEGSLQRLISHYPRVLLLPVKRVDLVTRLLKEKCHFTSQQVTDILRHSPMILEEDLAQLEYKFQYVYFRMGVQQNVMVKAKLFQTSLFDLRCRHCFLERRGLYQTPDKKGQTLIINPALKDILCVSEETFLRQIAKATKDEFRTFTKLMERELEEEEMEDYSSSDDDDEDDDYDFEVDEEDDEHPKGKTCYKPGKK
ncbi:hypothetical protein DNTS_035421, partial [Danionella cerebrum]